MSCVCVLTPLVVAAWPAFSAAVVAAASSLGYQMVAEAAGGAAQKSSQREITLEIAQSQLVTGTLGRDQRIQVTRDGVLVTFSRDARGKAAVCVSGQDLTEEAMRKLGEEISHRVVQQYVYQQLMQEMQARQFVVVEEATDANHAIHLKVRHWEG